MHSLQNVSLNAVFSHITPTDVEPRVVTNLENLEYSGISMNIENSWNSQGILCNLRENL